MPLQRTNEHQEPDEAGPLSGSSADGQQDVGNSVHAFVPGMLGAGSIAVSMDNLFEQCLRQRPDELPEPWGGVSKYSFRDVYGDMNQPDRAMVLAFVRSAARTDADRGITSISTRGLPFLSAVPMAGPAMAEAPVLALMFASQAEAAALEAAHAEAQAVMLDIQSSRAAVTLLAGPSRSERRRNLRRTFNVIRTCSRVDTLEANQATAKETCSICLEELSEGQRVRTLPCFHRLHGGCSTRYFKARDILPRCPVCRADLGLGI